LAVEVKNSATGNVAQFQYNCCFSTWRNGMENDVLETG